MILLLHASFQVVSFSGYTLQIVLNRRALLDKEGSSRLHLKSEYAEGYFLDLTVVLCAFEAEPVKIRSRPSPTSTMLFASNTAAIDPFLRPCSQHIENDAMTTDLTYTDSNSIQAFVPRLKDNDTISRLQGLVATLVFA